MADVDVLKKLYPIYQTTLDDPYLLQAVSYARNLPYEITTWEKGVSRTVCVVNSFADLVFGLMLRDPVHRSLLCLSNLKIFEIAVREQDEKLFPEAYQNLTFQNSHMLTLIGKSGNVELIGAGLNFFDRFWSQMTILSGLIHIHRNDLFHKFVETLADQCEFNRYLKHLKERTMVPFQDSQIVGLFMEAAAISDNLEIFQENLELLQVVPGQAIVEAALHNSEKVIKQIETFKSLDNISAQEKLFGGYVEGGHLEKAKRVFDQFQEGMFPSGSNHVLARAIFSGSVETLHYAEGLQKKLTGSTEFEVKTVTDYIRIKLGREKSASDNDSLWVYLTSHPEYRSKVFEVLSYSDDLEGLIKYMELFEPPPEDIPEFLKKVRSDIHINQCFLKWLDHRFINS